MPIFGALMGFSLFLGSTAPFGKAATPTPVAPEAPSYVVKLTAYNAVPEQTDESPFETASGAYSNPEIIAARSQDLAAELPFGTIVELRGPAEADNSCGFDKVQKHIGYRVIGDSMNSRFTKRIDILFGTDVNHTMPTGKVLNAAHVLGICTGVTVRVVGYVSINHIPETQEALAALVAKGRGIALK